ncbi:MAG: chemotaxis protein CheW [Gallionella sp.]
MEEPMSIDMSQFYQVFFDEAAEHLASMESLLLAFDPDAPDADQLNAIFRAAHSIKGGSGTFGFTDMADVTHILETLLDRIRKNEIALTRGMVDVFLRAGDVLRGLLDAHQNGAVADEAASIEICATLERLANNSGGAPAAESAHPPAAKTHTSVRHVYRIRFANSPGIFPDRLHLENLLDDLGNLGKVENKIITDDAVDLSLTAYASEADLREIFSFFLKPDQLAISVQGAVSDNAAGAGQGYGLFDETCPAGADEEGYGFFVEPGAIKSGMENAQGYGFFEEPVSRIQPPPRLDARHDDIPGRRAVDRVSAVTGSDTSIRVSVGKVDAMINLVGELVITQSMLAEIVSSMDPVLHEQLINGLAQLERNTRDLQDSVMSVRMMPISLVFNRFQRVVRDSAGKLNKKVQLKIIGESTELDKGLIEKISDPLTHLVRNSLDHGIELPEERVARGKDPQGTITLRAAHQGGNILIEVSDDGAGLNRERILATARENGISVSDGMSDEDVWKLIYAPGFTTAIAITDVSGRGVGMDVVKRNIEGIGGRVDVTSRQGKGSTVAIRLPLTLAILDGLSVAVGEQIYIIPLGFIIESFRPGAGDINEISGQGKLVQVRGEYLPIITLHKVFNIKPKITDPCEGILVLLETEGRKVALFVDELVGQHQVVIKSLETNYRKVDGVSGATIMGDGRVAMIMDVSSLVKLSQRFVPREHGD